MALNKLFDFNFTDIKRIDLPTYYTPYQENNSISVGEFVDGDKRYWEAKSKDLNGIYSMIYRSMVNADDAYDNLLEVLQKEMSYGME